MLPKPQKWTPKQAKAGSENTTHDLSQGNFAQKSNSDPTLLILCSYYSGLNISVVSPMLCFHLQRPHSSHLQHFLTISSRLRWHKCDTSVMLEGAPTVINLIFFARLLKFLRFGVCPGGLGYPTQTHLPTPETTPSTTRASISVPLGSPCGSYQTGQFPLSHPEDPHLFLCYSSVVPLLREASWPLELFQQHKAVQQTSPHQWGRSLQLHLLRWTLSTSGKGQCLANNRTAISKKDNPLFCGHLVPFAHWELPKYYWLLSAIFHVKRNFSHPTKIPILSKRCFLVNLTKKRQVLSDLCPFESKGWDALQLSVLEDTATPTGMQEATRDLTQCCLDLHVFKSVALTAHSSEHNQSQGGRSLTGNEEI